MNMEEEIEERTNEEIAEEDYNYRMEESAVRLGLNKGGGMKQRVVADLEIRNFILFFTSDDDERERMNKVADVYMKDMFEEHN